MPRTNLQQKRCNMVAARMVSEYLRSGKTVPEGFKGTLFDFARYVAGDIVDLFDEYEIEHEDEICDTCREELAEYLDLSVNDFCMGCGESCCTCNR